MYKKLNLLLTLICCSMLAIAQSPYSLSGTTYVQNFDNLSSGLPLGWRVDTLVKPSAGLGNNAITRFSPTAVNWTSTSRGFKNVASADALTATATNSDQNSSTDRALAVRQVSASGWDDHDTLASFGFNISNTVGLTGFTLSYKLMSLNNTVKRYNTWIVQYGIGASPTSFNTVTTTPTSVIMDSNFSTVNVSANFGSSLNNISVPVWIRICPLDSTMGIGNRPLVGLDDFNLSWSGTAVNNTPQVTSYFPAAGASNVATSVTDLTITFDKTMVTGTGNVTVKNLTDATQQVIAASACSAAGTGVTIPGVTLATGKTYAVQYDSTCFESNGYKCLGVYDNTTWSFSTTPAILPPVTSLNETFTGCSNTAMGLFTQQTVTGTQTWRCSNFGRTDSFSVYMNGGTAQESFENEDWLLSPRINVSAMSNPYLHFWTKRRFGGTNTKEVFVSNSYTNDVTTVSWGNALVPNMSTLDSNNWNQIKNLSLNSIKSTPFTIAFKYVSTANTPSIAEEWTIDDVQITDGPLNISSTQLESLSIYVATRTGNDQTQLVVVGDRSETVNLMLHDIRGAVLAQYQIQVANGKNYFSIPTATLPNGIYVLHLQNDRASGVVKFVK
jgi:hypothetical protein